MTTARSLDRITGLLSRIKYRNRGIFYRMTFSVVDHFFQKKKTPDLFRTKLIWVGSGWGLGLELVSKVVWAFFEIFLLVTLEPHVGHTKSTDFYTSSQIIIHTYGKASSLAFAKFTRRSQNSCRSRNLKIVPGVKCLLNILETPIFPRKGMIVFHPL